MVDSSKEGELHCLKDRGLVYLDVPAITEVSYHTAVRRKAVPIGRLPPHKEERLNSWEAPFASP